MQDFSAQKLAKVVNLEVPWAEGSSQVKSNDGMKLATEFLNLKEIVRFQRFSKITFFLALTFLIILYQRLAYTSIHHCNSPNMNVEH